MKAVRFYAKDDVRVEDVPAPNSLGDSALIKPLTCGICGTDLHEFAGGPIATPVTKHKLPAQCYHRSGMSSPPRSSRLAAM
jgi:(R,R)-butanediol dehydrogenase/meso-butanediol dehydrogenase/diacetyl reductase